MTEEERKKPKIIPNRTPIPEQDPKERGGNFNEVALGYSIEQALLEAERCIGCRPSSCHVCLNLIY